MGLDITGIGSAFDFGSKIIDKIWPDKTQADQAKLAMFQAQQAGAFKEMDADLELAKAQIAANAVEAASPSVFVSGWRPAVGWVCVSACAWNWIGLPIAVAAAAFFKYQVQLAPADLSQMTPILIGMLGLGGMRMVEKLNGVASK